MLTRWQFRCVRQSSNLVALRGFVHASATTLGTSHQAQQVDLPDCQLSPAQQEMQTCRVWAVSDLHTDYAINMNLWARGMDSTNTQKDVLLLAGDVCDDLATLEETLALLCAKFQHVFYVVGNHELWVRESDR